MRLRSSASFSRRQFLQAGAAALAACVMPPLLRNTLSSWAALEQDFIVGANYPWIAYGHDFGKNAWGHDGILTSGWTYQAYTNSQGFIDTRRSEENAHAGTGSLRILVDLVGQHANKSQGEVYVDLATHAPIYITAPIDLTNVPVHCWLYLPTGSAGPASARNGVQIFLKSQEASGDPWYSFYSAWTNIEPDWEKTWVEFVAQAPDPGGYSDPQFNPAKVVAVGLKVAINDASDALLGGTIYLDDFRLDTVPPLLFDFEKLEWERDLDTLRCSNEALRIFVFADGGAAPEFSPTGEVASPGFDEYFFQDFDALLSMAQTRNVSLIPVLLDFSWCYQAREENGVLLGGHSEIVRDGLKRQSFIDHALIPLVQRYAGSRHILAWDLINEPEWVVQEIAPNSSADAVTLQQMRDFVQACSDAVHQYGTQPVTLGSARRKWLQHWQGIGLDLYQFHWYDHHAPEETFPWLPYSALSLDKPCIVGEVPTENTVNTVEEYLDAAYTGGYHGLLLWSYRARDELSNHLHIQQNLAGRCTYLPMITHSG